MCGLQVLKNQSENKEMVKTTVKHVCVYQERKSSMHSGEWYSAPVNFLGLLCIWQTLEISWCETCSCGFISSAGFWVRVLSCGFAFWGCLLFFPSLSNEKCKGKKFTSSRPQRAGLLSSIHILTLCLSLFPSSAYYCTNQSALSFSPESMVHSLGSVLEYV